MKQSLTFIALRSTPISDKKSVLNAYSLQAGRVAFVVSGGASREAVRRRAILQPLCIAEGVASGRNGGELLTLSQISAVRPMPGLFGNPVKNAVALFVTELLTVLLREGQPDPHLFNYIEMAIGRLANATTRQAANFHICFLLHLARIVGIEPDWETFAPGLALNLDEGLFCPASTVAPRMLSVDESAAAARLSRITFDNMGWFRFSRQQRNRALDVILAYFSLHYAPLASLRSLEVVRMLF